MSMPRIIESRIGKCGGMPIMEGTRLTCCNIVMYMKDNPSWFYDIYPDIGRTDVIECLKYCSTKSCIDFNVPQFCLGCTLNIDPDDPNTPKIDTWIEAEILLVKSESPDSKCNNLLL